MPPPPINDYVPTEEEVEWAVQRLRGHQSRGPSRISAEHLPEWLWEHRSAEATAEVETEEVGEKLGTEGQERPTTEEGMTDEGEERDKNKWEKVVELFQLASRDGVITDEEAWQTVVLILKGGGDYRGIGIVDVIWKAVAVIINHRFTAAITYHDSLHGFWAGRGTRTTTLEVNLLQQVAALREAVFQAIFLGLHRDYDALERSR